MAGKTAKGKKKPDPGGKVWKQWEDPEELLAAMRAYFQACDDNSKLYGEAGLALAIRIPLCELRDWFDGKSHPEFFEAAQWAYTMMADQLESSPLYNEKAMQNVRIFRAKQARLLNYQDKPETTKNDISVKIQFGKNMDHSDLE